MENSEFIQLYNEFKEEQHNDFHFQLLSEKIKVSEIKGNKITLCAQNEFSRDNFKARYMVPLHQKLLQKMENALLEITLNQQSEQNKTYLTHLTPNPAHSTTAMHSQELQFGGQARSIDNIDTRRSFANYIEGPHNVWAITVGKALSKQRNDNYNPFFIWGNVGLGKTHMLHAIGNACKNNLQKVLYTNTETFFNHFVNAIKSNRQEYFKKKYRSVDVLLLDDIHDLKNKSKAQEELYYIFEYFRDKGKQLVFTCDRPPQELKEFTDRLLSRLKSGTNVAIEAPSNQARLLILQEKSRELGLVLPEQVFELLAENICDSIRDLHGALNKLDTLSKLLEQKITVDLVSRELQEFFSQRSRPVVVRNIQGQVAAYYNLELADILGPRRNANIALARQVAMFLARQLTPLSTTELGREFNRNHATVITGVRKIEKMRKADHKFTGELDSLKRALQTVS